MGNTEKEIVQQIVSVKKIARMPNLVLEIPDSIKRKDLVKIGVTAGVSESETDESYILMYEFKKGENNDG